MLATIDDYMESDQLLEEAIEDFDKETIIHAMRLLAMHTAFYRMNYGDLKLPELAESINDIDREQLKMMMDGLGLMAVYLEQVSGKNIMAIIEQHLKESQDVH